MDLSHRGESADGSGLPLRNKPADESYHESSDAATRYVDFKTLPLTQVRKNLEELTLILEEIGRKEEVGGRTSDCDPSECA